MNYDRSSLGSRVEGTEHSGYGREHAHETLAEFGYTAAVRLPAGRSPLPQCPAVRDVLTLS